ncbi:MAG TPA: disulfide bond formation protein B, partial [Xanthobacteraceae bacterium]|nr:disulfide bond formation protein B [Xanthobacteraceae bacterium]
MTRSLALTLNALGLYAIALVLAVAFAAQLLLDELPCPLCLIQRIQFAMLAVGPILNVRFGPRPATMPSRSSPPSPARPLPRGRFCSTSCLETPGTARRCSATTTTAGRS